MGGDTQNKNKMPVTSRARHWQRGSSLFCDRRKRRHLRHLNSRHSENIRYYDRVYATYMLLWLICILLCRKQSICDCYCRRSSSESKAIDVSLQKKKYIRFPQQQCLHLRYLKIDVTQLKNIDLGLGLRLSTADQPREDKTFCTQSIQIKNELSVA